MANNTRHGQRLSCQNYNEKAFFVSIRLPFPIFTSSSFVSGIVNTPGVVCLWYLKNYLKESLRIHRLFRFPPRKCNYAMSANERCLAMITSAPHKVSLFLVFCLHHVWRSYKKWISMWTEWMKMLGANWVCWDYVKSLRVNGHVPVYLIPRASTQTTIKRSSSGHNLGAIVGMNEASSENQKQGIRGSTREAILIMALRWCDKHTTVFELPPPWTPSLDNEKALIIVNGLTLPSTH